MKISRTRILGIGAVLLLIGVIGLFVSCHQIENQDAAVSLGIKVNLEGAAPRSSGEPAGVPVIKRIADPGFTPEGMVDPPETDIYFLKIVITNPLEVFLVYDYIPGEEIRIMVASGNGREVWAEVYLFPGGVEPSTGWVPVSHYLTSTPRNQRLLDLAGEPVNITIQMAPDSNLGEIQSNQPHTLIDEYGDSSTLPVSFNCPPNWDFYANVVDKNWGLKFPSALVEVLGGGTFPVTFSLAGLPLKHTYGLEVWQDYTYLSTIPRNVLVADSVTVIGSFTFYSIAPYVTFSNADEIQGAAPASMVIAYYDGEGGLGNFMTGSLGLQDTCGGTIINPGMYEFTSPLSGSCDIHIEMQDCRGITGEGILTVTVNPDCVDGDGDFYYNIEGCGTPVDCNDGNNTVYPGAPDFQPSCPGDGIDNNCPGDPGYGLIDEDPCP